MHHYDLLSLSAVAAQLGTSPPVIEAALRRLDLQPTATFGGGMFTGAQVTQLRDHLARNPHLLTCHAAQGPQTILF